MRSTRRSPTPHIVQHSVLRSQSASLSSAGRAATPSADLRSSCVSPAAVRIPLSRAPPDAPHIPPRGGQGGPDAAAAAETEKKTAAPAAPAGRGVLVEHTLQVSHTRARARACFPHGGAVESPARHQTHRVDFGWAAAAAKLRAWRSEHGDEAAADMMEERKRRTLSAAFAVPPPPPPPLRLRHLAVACDTGPRRRAGVRLRARRGRAGAGLDR